MLDGGDGGGGGRRGGRRFVLTDDANLSVRRVATGCKSLKVARGR